VSVEWINKASVPELERFFRQCCTCEIWIHRMVSGRPYNSRDAVLKTADVHWRQLDESDYLQAFEGHPMIGNIHSLQTKYADTRVLAANEQSKVNIASHETLEALVAANAEYKTRFGFVFIVNATSKSAREILVLLQGRLGNSRDEEIHNAAREQCKITRIRLEKLL